MQRRQNYLKNSAFSLVEVSIVLAIIGLLIGGILTGKALMDNQRNNAIISKANELRIALQQFKLKYAYYPGDLPTATQIWGRADGGAPVTSNCANPGTDNSNINGTCNGNGDGAIWEDGANFSSGVLSERARAWQQLKLAGMIVGNYDGVTRYPELPGVTYPTMEGKLNSSFTPRTLFVDATRLISGIYYDGDYNGAVSYGYSTDVTFDDGLGPIMSGEAAFNIDRKIDDGFPALGKVRSPKPFSTPDCPVADAYPVNRKDDVCALIFMGEKQQ